MLILAQAAPLPIGIRLGFVVSWFLLVAGALLFMWYMSRLLNRIAGDIGSVRNDIGLVLENTRRDRILGPREEPRPPQ